MLGLARAVPKIALHSKVSGIGRFRLPTDLFTASQGAVGFYSSHGKAVMRSFAAPYGTSVTVSSARLVVTGLTGNTPGESSTSVHCGSRRAFVAISTGAASAVYG